MKRKFVYLALAALAFGIVTSPKTTADQPPRTPKHDVVFLSGHYGYPYVLASSSSSNAPVFHDYNWTNNSGDLIADAVAQLLDENFEQKSALTIESGGMSLQFVRRR